MKKPSFDKDAIQQFFVNHGEKVAFGLSLVIVGLFVYFGYSLEGYSEKTPDQLRQQAQLAEQHIQQTKWETLEEERTPIGRYAIRARDASAKTTPEPYALRPLDPPKRAPGAKRLDPDLLAPEKFELVAVTGPLALRLDARRNNPLEELKAAEPDKKRVKKKKKKKDRGGDNPYGGDDYDGSGDGGDVGDSGGDGDGNPYGGGDDAGSSEPGVGSKRIVPSSALPADYRPREAAGDDPNAGDGEGYGGKLSSGGSGGAGATLDGPGGPGGDGPAADDYEAGGKPTAKVAPSSMVAVKLLFPFKKQLEKYDEALRDSVEYNARRDIPNLIFYEAQYVDVTDDPAKEIKEEDWKAISNTKKSERDAKDWHGSPSEIAVEKYVNKFVTMNAPPLMMRDVAPLMNHSLIEVKAVERKADAGMGDSPYGDEGTGEGGGDVSDSGGEGNPYGSGGSGEGNPYGGGGAGEGNPYGGGGESGNPYGGSDEGSTKLTPRDELPEYKLIRFYHLGAQPGHVYRYRVRVYLDDPNNPNTNAKNGPTYVEPSRRSLDSEVLARITKVKEASGGRPVFYRITDWSEPSDPISVPAASQVAVGGIEAPRYSGNVQVSDPSGWLAAISLDPKYGIDVSKEVEVYHGSILNISGDLEVLDPVTLVIKQLPNYDLKTDFLVADMMGGEDLPGKAGQDKLQAPGQYALIDASGKIVVHRELDDKSAYRLFSFKDEKTTGGVSASGGFGGGLNSGGSGEGGAGGTAPDFD